MKKLSAVHGVLMVLCLLLGVAIGGLGPRSDARSLRAKLAESKECEGSGVGADIASVFRGRPWEQQKAPTPVIEQERAPATPEVEEDTLEINLKLGEEEPQANPSDQLDLARDALEIRYQQALEALIQDADPSEQQLTEIHQVLDKMNDELIGLATDLAEGEPTRHDAMLYAAETLDVMLETEDKLGSVLTEEQRGALQDESLDPMSYVDPALIDVLERLEK